jgi:hypothetical protein
MTIARNNSLSVENGSALPILQPMNAVFSFDQQLKFALAGIMKLAA